MTAQELDTVQVAIRINTLHARLAEVEAALAAPMSGNRAEGQFAAVVLTVGALNDFLKSIPALAQVSTPMKILLEALSDISKDVQPEIFRTSATQGRKTSTFGARLRIHTVACVEWFKAAGMGAGAARNKVAELWDKLKVRQTTGATIKAHTIEEWEGWLRECPVGSMEHSHFQWVQSQFASGQWNASEVEERVRAWGSDIAKLQTWQDRFAGTAD